MPTCPSGGRTTRTQSTAGVLRTPAVSRWSTAVGNLWFVPYSPLLSLRYCCHVNTEIWLLSGVGEVLI